MKTQLQNCSSKRHR